MKRNPISYHVIALRMFSPLGPFSLRPLEGPKVVLKCETEDVEEPRPLHGATWRTGRRVSHVDMEWTTKGRKVREEGRPTDHFLNASSCSPCVPGGRLRLSHTVKREVERESEQSANESEGPLQHLQRGDCLIPE